MKNTLPSNLTGSGQNLIVKQHGSEVNPAIMYLMHLQSKGSRRTARSNLKSVARMLDCSDFTDMPWQMIRREHLLMLMERLRQKGLSPATINTYLAVVMGVMRECWQAKLITIDEFERLKSVRREKGTRLGRGRALSKEAISKILTACQDGTAIGLRDEAMFAVLIGCGLRRQEVVSLNYEDIDFDEKAFKLIGKGNKERRALIPPTVWSRVLTWIDEVRGRMNGALFVRIRQNDDTTSDRLTDQAVYYRLNQLYLKAGVGKVAPHDLRRTFATMMFNNGEDLMTVKEALGHSSVTTTQRYLILGDEKLKSARDKITI